MTAPAPKSREEWEEDIQNICRLYEDSFSNGWYKQLASILDSIMSLQSEVERVKGENRFLKEKEKHVVFRLNTNGVHNTEIRVSNFEIFSSQYPEMITERNLRRLFAEHLAFVNQYNEKARQPK